MIRIPALLTAGLLVLLGLPGYVVTARDYASHFAHIFRREVGVAPSDYRGHV